MKLFRAVVGVESDMKVTWIRDESDTGVKLTWKWHESAMTLRWIWHLGYIVVLKMKSVDDLDILRKLTKNHDVETCMKVPWKCHETYMNLTYYKKWH